MLLYAYSLIAIMKKFLKLPKGDKYVGEHIDGKPHGKGTYTFFNGDKYVGKFKNDNLHGQGTYTFSNGDKYIGEYNDGKYYGQGTYTSANGDKYVGEWKDDKRNGQGTYTFANGDKYVGEFEDDLRHGQGTYTFANGDKYAGEFKNGFLNLYKLSPLYKVSQIDTWFNKKNKKKFYMIQDFSSGTITIDTKDYKNFTLKTPPKIFDSIIDVNLKDNDGVNFESKDLNKKDLEKIYQIFEDGYEEALEKIGFKIDPDLVKYEFTGGFNAEKI